MTGESFAGYLSPMLELISHAKWKIEKRITSHPITYFWTKRLLERIPWFLPHDKDFYGIAALLGSHSEALVVDIGANDGISARSLRRLLPQIRIHSIEAHPYHQASLEKLKNVDKSFSYKIIGLGSSTGAFNLYTPFYGEVPIHSAASFKREEILKALSTTYGEKILRSIEIREVRVQIETLDAQDLSPHFLKIDAEGFELEILNGAHATLRKSKPMIMLEMWNSDKGAIQNCFNQHDYKICYFNEKSGRFSYAPPEIIKNAFALPREVTESERFKQLLEFNS